MKIVFLDFDGVLNTMFSIQAKGAAYWKDPCDATHVAHLNAIISASDAKVVISSAWRVGRTLSDLRELLQKGGFVGEVIGKTERFGRRGDECSLWLREFDPHSQRVEAFVVLEDGSDMDQLEPHTVRTDPEEGLLEKHVGLALEILARPVWRSA